jgi:hypothetical protein
MVKRLKLFQKRTLIELRAEGKASSVQFIHFKFNDEQIEKFKSDCSLIEIGIDHKEYSHTAKLSVNTIKSLVADFS